MNSHGDLQSVAQLSIPEDRFLRSLFGLECFDYGTISEHGQVEFVTCPADGRAGKGIRSANKTGGFE